MAQDAYTSSERVVLHAGIGPELTQYDVDVDGAALVKRGSVRLPATAQYAWQHASKKYFYVATSDSGSGTSKGASGKTHHVCAFRVDPANGALQPHGEPIPLRQRPIHITTDLPSDYALIAYNDPSTVTVHRLNRDGTIGEEIKQAGPLDGGIFAHQIRVTPSNSGAILVTRGNDATRDQPADPGALKVFKYRDGVLSDVVSVAPGGGYGFGPRHLDFHPTQPWVFVSLESQHKIHVFTLTGTTLSSEPLFAVDTLAEPANVRPRQRAGTIHVHPNGRFVYGCERATYEVHGQATGTFRGGENTIVAYSIDQRTGEPTFIQRVETRGFHPRTFSIEPTGRLLIAAAKSPVVVEVEGGERYVPASLDVFRISSDGKLDYVRKYDVDVGNAAMVWTGFVRL